MKIFTKLLFCLVLVGFPRLLFTQNCEKLIWSDEFNGTSLDLSKWNYDLGNGCPDLCGWGNNEEQYYTDATDNVSVANGLLTITAKNDTLGGMAYSSGRITTKGKADFRYGRIEASIRLPETQGLWPAFWMLPTDNVYGEWPKSGEIDILELLGDKPHEVLGTIHTGLPWTFVSEIYELDSTVSFADTFHTFSLTWDMDTVRWFVDGNMYHEVVSDSLSPWPPFQEDFHLLLNVAVGGNLPGFTDSTTVLPQVMEVDWVRVYNSPERLVVRGEQPVEGETGMRYSTFAMDGATYTWTAPAGASIVSGQGTSAINLDWGCTPGDLLLEIQTDCDTVMLTYAVNQFAELDISGANTLAQNQGAATFSIPPVAGANYTWIVPGDAIIISGQATNEITVDWGCAGGEVIVEAAGTCTSLRDTFAVNLETYTLTGLAAVPANATGRKYSINDIPNATYVWTVPADASIIAGAGTSEITVDFGTQGGDVSVEVTNACGPITYVIAVRIDAAAIYCDFDGTDKDWGVFGGTVFEKVANPNPSGINTSNNVGQTRKDPGAQNWGGIFADLGGEMDLDANSFLHMKVYAELAGVVKFKVEDQTTGVAPVEIDVPHDSVDKWVTMIWDFTGHPAETYDRIALFFDFGDTDTSYWYFDDVIGRSSASTVSVEKPIYNPIQVYPNPNNGKIQVDMKGLFLGTDAYDLQILGLNGQVFLQERKFANTQQFELDTQALPSGTYILRFLGKDLQYVKTIVKQ